MNQTQKATKENLTRTLPQIFGDDKFSLRASKETFSITWEDGVCIDRVIKLLTKNKIDWRNVKFQRNFDVMIMKNFIHYADDNYKKTVADFYPKYREQLEDEAQLISLIMKGKFFDNDRASEFFTKIEINNLIEQNRIYLEEPIIKASASHQDHVYKIKEGLERAVLRFFETDEVKKKQEYLQMKHELPTKPQPQKKPTIVKM